MEKGGRFMEKGNRGSATVEAALLMPFFLFGILAIYGMLQCRRAEAELYEACVKTAEYTAEYCSIGEMNPLVPMLVFDSYVDDRSLVERYVEGGTGGVLFFLSHMEGEYVVLEAYYRLKLTIPFFPLSGSLRHLTIRQRAYIGDQSGEESNAESEEDVYVYVTENREVYHMSRSCTHLELSPSLAELSDAKAQHYTACEFCGIDAAAVVIITPEGDRYHSSPDCSGLKRTVYRVKKSSVAGLSPCSRCGGNVYGE